MSKQISVIIPTLNEEACLPGTLDRLKQAGNIEIIVADGGSVDKTAEIARNFTGKVLITSPGRALQMNEGARRAQGDIFLFLHADSLIAPGGLEKLLLALQESGAVGGAFRLEIDSGNTFLKSLARMANLRCLLSGIPYGDQGIFILRETFQKIGGYPEIPILEDVELARKMKRAGKTILLKERMTTSARRWKKEGLLMTTVRHRWIMLLYFLGASPKRLGRFRHA